MKALRLFPEKAARANARTAAMTIRDGSEAHSRQILFAAVFVYQVDKEERNGKQGK